MRYFYFTFMTQTKEGFPFLGNMCLAQHRSPTGNDDGFNFPNASDHIRKLHGQRCVIISWNETTETRYFEWKNLVEKDRAEVESGKKPASILSLVPQAPEAPCNPTP